MAGTNSRRLISALMILIIAFGVFSMTGCQENGSELKDGYYTAEDKYGSHGWYEFITIYVSDGKILSAEYNAKNDSGFIKSWDMTYMREMNAVSGTYPNEYTRLYAEQLVETQSADKIDTITGATHSYDTFTQLAKTVLSKAKTGDTSVSLVEVEHVE